MLLDELFWLLWNGSSVAWGFVALAIALVGTFFCIVWFYHKMPKISKLILWNELFNHNPILLNCYDDQYAEFQNPKILSEGLFWQKTGPHKGLHLHPHVPDELLAKEEMETEVSRTANGVQQAFKSAVKHLEELYKKAFHISGSSSRFYVAYSGKAEVVNPEILALLEHNDFLKKASEGEAVYVKKDALLMALNNVKDEYVQLKPMFLTTFLDGRMLKQWLSKSYGDTQLAAFELHVREDERAQRSGKGGMDAKKLVIVCLIGAAILVGFFFVGQHFGYF